MPTTHSFFITFFVPPWFCIFAKARTLRDALTFAKKQNAIPQNKKSAKKPISPKKNHKIKERPYEICFAEIFHRASPINAPDGATCLPTRQKDLTAVSPVSFSLMINYSEDSGRGSVMMKKSSFMIYPLMQLSGFQPERLIQLSILTICTDVNMPDKSGDILTRSDAWSLAIPGLLADVDLFSIINSNLLIIRIFCQYFVDKKFELRSEVFDKFKKAFPRQRQDFLFGENSSLLEVRSKQKRLS
jgi:hypothetical protein